MENEVRRVALVTGANKGIGYEVARQLASGGATALIGARNTRRGEEAARTMREAGLDAHPVPLDVTDPGSIRAAAASIEERFGRLDALVNNAGISGDFAKQTPSTADMNVMREVFETNFFGVMMVTNAMIPLLMRSTAPRIVNMSSSIGSLTLSTDPDDYRSQAPARAAYPTSKTALNSLTVQYSKELREHDFLVNLADPGLTDTDFTKNTGGGMGGQRPNRTAAQAAKVAVRLATLGPDGPNGGFFNDETLFNDEGTVPW